MSNRLKIKEKNKKKSTSHFTNNDSLNKKTKEIFEIFNIKDRKTQKLLIKIIKFVIVGGIATIISGVVFFLCDYFLKTSVLISNTIAFIISVIYNYWASCKYVFEVNKEKSSMRRFVEFIIFALIGYILAQLLLWIMADIWRWNHMLAWFIETIIVMIFNFITRQMFLEKKDRD